MKHSFISAAALPTVGVLLAFWADQAAAQTPLTDRRFSWGNLPYKADTDDGVRGRQYGYNRCNSTTQNQESLCQTAVINSIDDWCIWGPPEPNSIVGNTEGEMVAWCTKSGYGTRLIPENAVSGVQFIRTPSYIQVTGRIDQTLVNIAADDYGGEMDPIGADRRGNPLGGLMYSNAFSSNTSSFQQIIYYHNFMGGGVFCLKACVPGAANQARMCEHQYDRIGCAFNAPASYANATFETCRGDDQLPPGIYVQNGVTSTYQQPPESLGPITSIPYVAAIPATSSCTPVPSSSIFAAGIQLAVSSASVVSASQVSVSASASSVAAASSSASAASVARTAVSTSSAASRGNSAGSSVPSASATQQNSAAHREGLVEGLVTVVALTAGAVMGAMLL